MLKLISAAGTISLTLLSPASLTHATAGEAEALETLINLNKTEQVNWDIESDGSDRIRLADRLMMLTQRVAASSCALTSGVAVEESHDYLENAMYEFDIILDALRYGNDQLHILGPEEDKRTLQDIDTLAAEWMTIHDAVESILANGQDVESAHIIDDHSEKMLHLATVLASDMSGQYTHPYEITQADAMLISLAGRQRMLTQRMSKDACEIWSHYHEEQGRADLQENMVVFENSLTALRFGMPAAGVKGAPTDVIAKDLDSLLERWGVLKGNLETLVAGGDLDMDQKFEVFHDFNVELDELNHLVNDYTAYADRNH